MSKTKKSTLSSRRNFIKASATTAAGFMIVPRHVLGKGFVAPSDKLNLATIGAGGKGWSDINNAYANGVNNVVAICDIDFKHADRAITTFDTAKKYKDFRRMIDEMGKDIDAVTISGPDHMHGIAAMAAMQEGMHVYVQKPLTHNIYEARMLTEGARKYRVVSQMGNQGASNPGQVQMMQWFNEGLIGKVHTVHCWTNRPVWPQGIPVPTDKQERPAHLSDEDWELYIGPGEMLDYHSLYYHFKWRGWWNFGTGALGDMGCHIIDPPFRVLGLGYPTDVECSVGQVFTKDWTPEYIPEGCPPSSYVKLSFPSTAKNDSPVTLIWSDGGIRPSHPDLIPADEPLSSTGSDNGVIMIGEKGIMTCGVYGAGPIVWLNNGDKIEMPKDFDGGNSYALTKPEYGHQLMWTEACKAGFDSKEHRSLTSSFDYAGPMTETVLMGNLAIRSYQTASGKNDRGQLQFDGRKKLLWDGKNMKITNYEPANAFVKREYRQGWQGLI